MDEEYKKRWHTHYMARGERYTALHPEYISLRSFYVETPDEQGYAGVALPDGRMLLWQGPRTAASYSSEQALLNRIPGARLFWHPDADAAINKVSEEDMPCP